MPLRIIKTVWDYCSYNKKFLLFILGILLIFGLLQDFFIENYGDTVGFLAQTFFSIILIGYGLVITRDIINHGIRLPKIIIKDVLLFGIKGYLVFVPYLFVQGFLLSYISDPLNLPDFDLKDMLLNLPKTIHVLYSNNPVNAVVFVILGLIIFYVTMFFAEIALARLADSKKILSAFDFKTIKKDIDCYGWIHYTKHFTLIIFAMVILSYLQGLELFNPILNTMSEIFFGLLVFVTQFLGIGVVFREIKDAGSRKNIEVKDA